MRRVVGTAGMPESHSKRVKFIIIYFSAPCSRFCKLKHSNIYNINDLISAPSQNEI